MSYSARAAKEANAEFAVASGVLEGSYRMERALEDLFRALTSARTPANREPSPDMTDPPMLLLAEAHMRMTRSVQIVELIKEVLVSKGLV